MSDLEPRVARLEASVSEIQTTLTRIEEKVNAKATREQVADLTVQLAEIRERLTMMSSMWQTIAIMMTLVASVAAIAAGALHLAGAH
jgi:hypothetical protein